MRGLVVWRQSFTRTPLRRSYWTPTVSRLSPSTFGARPAPARISHRDRLLLSLRFIADTLLAAIPLDASNPGVEPHRHALTDESALNNRGSVHVLAVEQVRILVE